jgi:hypothetical protein
MLETDILTHSLQSKSLKEKAREGALHKYFTSYVTKLEDTKGQWTKQTYPTYKNP